MSRRGVWQLQRLTLAYCEHGGSSAGARSFLQTHLPSLRTTYPHLDITITPRPGHHPFLRGDYANGNHRVQCVRGADARAVAEAADALVSCVGRKASVRLPARRHVPALRGPGGEAVGVQGGWRVEGGG